jgi:hypothetical protein
VNTDQIVLAGVMEKEIDDVVAKVVDPKGKPPKMHIWVAELTLPSGLSVGVKFGQGQEAKEKAEAWVKDNVVNP